MSSAEVTRAALASLESAQELADAVSHYFPEGGKPVQDDLRAFAAEVSRDLDEYQATSTIPPTNEVMELSEYLHRAKEPVRATLRHCPIITLASVDGKLSGAV